VTAAEHADLLELMEAMTEIAANATAVIQSRGAGNGIRTKADGSPVTAADEASEQAILAGLRRIAAAVPIVSEEQADREREAISEHASYFLVDPLDGTREFIAGRDEYTVNIALVSDGSPVIGVIVAPARNLVWRGAAGHGAERLAIVDGKLSSARPIRTRPCSTDNLIVMVSRSHLEPKTRLFLERFPKARLVQCGSSIKFCHIAEGVADIYPRLSPTRDWDIAAGHAILMAAGGRIATPDGDRLVYGTADRTIPGFIAWGGTSTSVMG